MDNAACHQAFNDAGDNSNGQYGNMSCTASPAETDCWAPTYYATNNHIAGYTYDAAGNVTNDGTNTYQWDAEAHLTAVIDGQSRTVSANTYNALGQRVRDVTLTTTTDEAYGAGGNLLWRYTGNSSTDRSFVPFNGGILAEYWSGGTLFDHPDELGSISTSSDYTGNNFAERLFYPYGEAWTGIDLNNFNMHQTFAQLPDYDAEIDQYNTLARHYSPTGRWLSPDPGGMKVIHLDAPQTWNLYAYVANNPTTLADPSGLDPVNQGSDLNYYDSDERRAEEDKLKQKNLVRSINVLGHEVAVKYAEGLTDDQMKAASDKLVAAAGVINGAKDLTKAEKNVLSTVKSVEVLDSSSGVYEGNNHGNVQLSEAYLAGQNAPLTASTLFHEGQHGLNAGKPEFSGANAWKDEKSATNMQIQVGRKLGLSDIQIHALEWWSQQQDKMQEHMVNGYNGP